LDGRFELGGLSLAPYSIRLELHDLVLLDAANDTLASVSGLRIQLSPWALLRGQIRIRDLRITEPWLRLETGPSGSLTLLAPFAPLMSDTLESSSTGSGEPPSFQLDRLQIDGLGLELERVGGLTRASLETLDLRASARWPDPEARLELALTSLTVQPAERAWTLDSLGLAGTLSGETLESFVIQARTGSSSQLRLDASAHTAWPDTRAQLALQFQLGLEELGLLPADPGLGGGLLVGQLELHGAVQDPSLRSHIVLSELVHDRAPIDSLVLELALDERVLALSQHLYMGGGGRETLNLQLDAREALPAGILDSLRHENLSWTANGQWQELDLAPWLASSVSQGWLGGSLDASGQGIDWPGLRATLALATGASGVELRGDKTPQDARLGLGMTVRGTVFTLDSLALALPGVQASGNGRADLADSSLAFSTHWQVDSSELPLGDALNAADAGLLSGRMRLDGSLLEPRLSLNAAHGPGVLAGLTLDSLDLQATASEHSLQLEQHLDLGSGGSQRLELEARSPNGWRALADQRLRARDPQWNTRLSLDSLDLAGLIPGLTFEGRVTGSLTGSGTGSDPERMAGSARLQISGQSLLAPGLADTVSLAADGNLVLAAGIARLDSLRLRVQELSLDGDARLNLNSETVEASLVLDAPRLASLPLALSDPISGSLKAWLELTGSIGDPRADLRLHLAEFESPWQDLRELNLAGHVAADTARVDSCRIVLDHDLGLRLSGLVTRGGEFALTLGSDPLPLELFKSLSRLPEGSGRLELTLTANGTAREPHLSGWLNADSLRYGDTRLLPLRLRLGGDGDTLTLSGEQFFRLDARYHPASGLLNARLDIPEQQLDSYLALAGYEFLSLRTALSIQVDGSLQHPEALQASLSIPELALGAWQRPLASGRNLLASWGHNTLSIDSFHLVTPSDGFLDLAGQGRVESLDYQLNARLPLDLAAPFTPVLGSLNGDLALQGRLAGSMSEPNPELDLQLDSLSLLVPVLDQRLHGVNARMRLEGNNLWLDDLSGSLDGGRFQAGGLVGLREFQPDSLDLRLRAQSLQLELQGTASTLLELDLRARGNSRQSRLTGDVQILDGLYYGDLQLNPGQLVSFISRGRERQSATVSESTNPLLRNMELDLALRTRRPFVVENNLLSTSLAPDLQIRGHLLDPLPSGRASLLDGTLRFAGREFSITRGILDFVNPDRIDPELDIESTVLVAPQGEGLGEQWSITLRVTGTASEPRLLLSSLPMEEDEDVLSILLTGRRSADLANLTGGGELSPQQVLARLLVASASERLRKLSGLDVLDVEMGRSGEGDTASENLRLTVGKSLSRRLTTYYSVEASKGSLVRTGTVEYRLLDDLSLSGFQNSTQEVGGELKLKREFR
ncbi:MAG: translocation/assembly module TamB domain-containing protein, partial [Candidatus Cloacimonetes bacterium]|nr:translocation/assembly module TamB domain-containing protein [Candidatus Cloacimonadota bacterium]